MKSAQILVLKKFWGLPTRTVIRQGKPLLAVHMFWFRKHIYENQLDMLQQQLTREPYDSPRLEIAERVPDYAKTGVYAPEWLELIEPSDFSLVGYRHHEPLSAPMAV